MLRKFGISISKPLSLHLTLIHVPSSQKPNKVQLRWLCCSSSQMGSSETTSFSSKLLFRQLFEKESSTYTYLLADVSHPDRPALVWSLISISFSVFISLEFSFGCFWLLVSFSLIIMGFKLSVFLMNLTLFDLIWV